MKRSCPLLDYEVNIDTETPTINIKQVQSEDIILKNIAKFKNINYIELFPHIYQERI